MLENFRQPWVAFLYRIDLKSYEYPWTEEQWEDLSGYIIRIYQELHVPRGFSSFKIIPDNIIKVSKLCVDPLWRCKGIGTAIHEDLIQIAMKYSKTKLITSVHELNEVGIKWLVNRGWTATGIDGKFPDGYDRFTFERDVIL